MRNLDAKIKIVKKIKKILLNFKSNYILKILKIKNIYF